MPPPERHHVDTIWRLLIFLAAVDLAIFAVIRQMGVVAFGLIFGAGFGGFAWRMRARVRPVFRRAAIDGFGGFLLLAAGIGAGEEILCWAMGNRIANPILWADLVQVCVCWSFWFATWYLYLARRFVYSEKEALLLGAGVGVLFEGLSSGALLFNPLLTLLVAPVVVIVYAAIFVLSLQLIDLEGTSRSRYRYPAGVILPYLASLPAGVVLAIVLPR